jgi:HSP20 family protein
VNIMLLTRKRTLAWGDLADLSWFPFLEPVIRIEEYPKDDTYVVRAELPGIDPAKDVEVTAVDGYLSLAVVRLDVSGNTPNGRSEFRHGTYHRTIALPLGTKEDTICAKYTDGILEITMTVGQPVNTTKTIPIATIPTAVGNGKAK